MSTDISQKLTGKVAVVTGASKGMCQAIAKQLAANGAAVVVNHASSKAGAEKVVGENALTGGQAVAVPADVAKKSEVEKLFAETKKAFGRLDILVKNAGIYEFSPLDGITEEHFHKQFSLNVFVLVVQSFLKATALKALTPRQNEPPFAITQLRVLLTFLLFGTLATVRCRLELIRSN